MASEIRREKTPRIKKTQAGKRLTRKKDKKTVLPENIFDEYVRMRAYYIWQELGQPQGADMEIWLSAEKDIRQQLAKSWSSYTASLLL